MSGTYTFTFTGARASGGSFTATAIYGQGCKARCDPRAPDGACS
jgi:hypothetical protein